jgi:Ig-like domain from next to BRCA1 gene
VLAGVYRAETLPTSAPGALVTVTVRLTNTGTSAWLSSGSQTVSLTYHVLTLAGNPWKPLTPFTKGVVAFGQGVTSLGHDVLPGHAISVRMNIQAPSSVGVYRIVWDAQQGTNAWFSQLGVLPYVERLDVQTLSTTPTAMPPTSTTTPTPSQGLRYIADTSIPDNSTVAATSSFRKGWLVYNNGPADWQRGWSLRLVSGNAFGSAHIKVLLLKACQTLNIIAQLKAPRRPGKYHSVWQLRDALNHPVGDRLSLVVTVIAGESTGTPTPTAVGTPTTEVPTPTQTPVG